MSYIAVPVPQYTDAPVAGVGGSHHRKAPAPGGEGVGGGASSLVPVQEHNLHTPSDIAKDALLKMLELSKDDPRRKYDQLCEHFVDYLDKCEQKGFMIKGYDTKKGKILNLPMSYDNRWGPARRKELSEKLKRLEFWFEMQEDRPVTMATLTSYHPADETVAGSWFKLNQARGKFLKMIKKHCGKDTDYFWVPEPHPSSDSGYVHYHIAIFADIPIELENKLRNLWSEKYKVGSHTYGLDFSQKKNKDDKIKHLKNYLSKYLEKGFLLKEWSIGLLIFNATLWETGFRMYGASTAIRKMMNIKDKPNNHIVWLETRMETVELTADNEEVQVSEVVWDRDYIPDWIDNSFWTRESNMIDWQWWHGIDVICASKPRDKIFHCNWGRQYKGMRIFEQSIAKLRAEPRVSTQEQERRKQQQEAEEKYKGVALTERQRRKLAQDGYL